jgi:manganese-dependent inorganic pyrophosphatase
VSAFIAARLLARAYPERRLQALLLGPAGPQTEWLFAQAGENLPPVRDDIRPTARECCRSALSITPHTSLGEALDILRTHRFSMLPVTDQGGHLVGLLSPHREESRFLYHFNTEDFLGILLEVADVVRALHLVPVNAAAATGPAPAAKAFRIFQQVASLQAGDLVLASAGEPAVAAAVAAQAAGLICCEASEEEASAWAKAHPGLPVWVFHGSLMALISDLPRAIPVGKVMSPVELTATGGEAVEDLRPLMARTPHALPVVDADGRLTGVLSRGDALVLPRPGAVLVDHFEITQTVRGLEGAEILEIIDHHRVGALETREPVRVDCRPLGSTATLLALRYEAMAILPSKTEALLLLGAVVADTLLLTSPTATAADREIAARLATLAGVDLQAFGREVLARNDGLATEEPDSLVNRDLKEFSQDGTPFLVGQIETVDLGLLTPERKAALTERLDSARARLNAQFAVLMVTDVLAGNSHLLIADPHTPRAAALLGGGDPRTGLRAEGMVSRKKQLLPLLLHRLAAHVAR